MKIAVCISGLKRTFVQCWDNTYENIIAPNNADYFICSPDILRHDLPCNCAPADICWAKNIYINEYDYSSYLKNTNPQKIQDILQQMRYLQWSHMLMARYEMNNGFLYDVVIRCRTDSLFDEPIRVKGIKDNTVYIPDHAHHGGWNDRFAYGNRDVMGVYNNRIDGFHSYMLSRKIFHPETYLKATLDLHKIGVSLLPQKVWRLREDGSKGAL